MNKAELEALAPKIVKGLAKLEVSGYVDIFKNDLGKEFFSLNVGISPFLCLFKPIPLFLRFTLGVFY